MRTLTPILAIALFAFASPAQVQAKLALNRAVVVAIHLPGSAKGMKHGAVTLVRLYPGSKKGETITAPLTAQTQFTRLGKKEREKIGLKDIKPGMVAVISASRVKHRTGYVGWELDALHVLGTTEEADPALRKLLGKLEYMTYVRVTKVGPRLDQYKQDLGRVEVTLANMPFILRVTRRTEIVWQTAAGKRTPAKLEDIQANPDFDVAISYPAALAFGDPPVAPATQIILNPRSKKGR